MLLRHRPTLPVNLIPQFLKNKLRTLARSTLEYYMTYAMVFEAHLGTSFVDALPLNRDCLEQIILKLDADHKARSYVTSFLAGLGTL